MACMRIVFLLWSVTFLWITHTHAQISSTFDSNADGWTASDSQTGPAPAYEASGGNPGGFISVIDAVAGTATYFNAPAKFLGNRSSYHGGILAFDLQVDVTPNSSTAGVRLTSSLGVVLVKLLPQLPAVAPGWSSYQFTLDESEEWRVGSVTGLVATATEIQAVLSSLAQLQINGEYSTVSNDGGGLDNVMLMPADAEHPPLIIYQAVSPDNDNKNEYWHIENITLGERRNNRVILINRWGDVVWESSGYNNTSVSFRGFDKNGRKLLPGIYYYEINLPNEKTETGFISLKY